MKYIEQWTMKQEHIKKYMAERGISSPCIKPYANDSVHTGSVVKQFVKKFDNKAIQCDLDQEMPRKQTLDVIADEKLSVFERIRRWENLRNEVFGNELKAIKKINMSDEDPVLRLKLGLEQNVESNFVQTKKPPLRRRHSMINVKQTAHANKVFTTQIVPWIPCVPVSEDVEKELRFKRHMARVRKNVEQAKSCRKSKPYRHQDFENYKKS